MSALRAACDEAMAGGLRVVGLAGEAGIGKTRCAEALAAYARAPRLRRGLGSLRGGRGRARPTGRGGGVLRGAGRRARELLSARGAPEARTRRASRCGRASRAGWPSRRRGARW